MENEKTIKLKSGKIAHELEPGQTVEVGDIIVCYNAFGQYSQSVIRVTKTLAIVRNNEVSEGKYERIYNNFYSRIPREKWRTSRYKVYRVAE